MSIEANKGSQLGEKVIWFFPQECFCLPIRIAERPYELERIAVL